jgi:homoserine kinase type II
MGAFTSLDSAIVGAIAAEYGLHVSEFHQLSGGIENTNALMVALEGNFVLTMLEKKDLAAGTAYAAYLHALADAGLPVPRIMQCRAGAQVTSYAGKPVIVSEYVAGRCYDPFPREFLFHAGATLAHVHTAQNITCPLPPYLRLRASHLAEIASFADAEFAEWVLRHHQRVRYVVESGSVKVPIHGDLFPDNIIVRGPNDLVFVDWDDGSLDYPWIDVGMAIIGLCCREFFVPGRARLFLGGYQSVAPDGLDMGIVRDAAIYVALFTSYNRYRRRGTSQSYADPRRSYRAIAGVVSSVQEQWGDVRV